MRLLAPYWPTRSVTSSIFDEMDKFFDEMNTLAPARFYDERTFDPACEVSEGEDHFLMSVDLPGMKKDDIKIEAAGNILTVSGERKREQNTDAKSRIQRYEKTYGFFKRSFTLPSSVEAEKVEARYENGVLEIYLPKVQAAKSRQIEIQSGKGGIFERLLGSKKSGTDLKDVNASHVS